MEHVDVRQTVRPIRYAFVVPSGDPAVTHRVMCLNSVLWGGLFNPIIAADDASSPQVLDAFDPDNLVDLSGGLLSEPVAERYARRIVKEGDVFQASGHIGRIVRIGLGMQAVLFQIYREAVRPSPESSRAVMVSSPSAEWDGLVAAQYGAFSGLPGEGPAIAVEGFQRLTDARTEAFQPTADQDDHDWVPPILVTGHGIRAYGPIGARAARILFFGDHSLPADWRAFWNLRATGRRVVFIPASTFANAKGRVCRFLGPPGSARADGTIGVELQKGSGPTTEAFVAFAEWIAAAGLGPPLPARSDEPEFGFERGWRSSLTMACRLQGRVVEELSIFDEGRLSPVRAAVPDCLGEDTAPLEQHWAVEVEAGAARLPNRWMLDLPFAPALLPLAERLALSPLSEPARLSRHGLVVTINSRSTQSRLHLYPAPSFDVFAHLLSPTGYTIEASKPGRYAERIIEKMRSLDFGCRLFKIRGVREVIKTLSNGSDMTKDEMQMIVRKGSSDRWGVNWRDDLYAGLYVVTDGSAAAFANIFKAMLDGQIIRPGLRFECESCLAEDWYHVSEFGERFVCRYCFHEGRVKFGSSVRWRYRSDGILRIRDSAQGSIATILGLWRLQHVGLGFGGKYLTSVNLFDSSHQLRHEIDFAFLSTANPQGGFELVLGEAKEFMEFEEAKVSRLADLAELLDPKPFLCFATLKDQFSEREKALLCDLGKRGLRVIALTREELDPYDLHARFDKAPHKYPVSLIQLAESSAAVNL